LNVSSVRGFVPMAFAALYSATKAGIHAYSMGLRYMLNGTSVEVQEIVPPWVQTDLLNSGEEPRAMPLQPFIEQTIEALGIRHGEILVEIAKPYRAIPGVDESALFHQMNDWFAQGRDRARGLLSLWASPLSKWSPKPQLDPRLTPARAQGDEHVQPQVEYYAQGASAGLIISEGTWVSEEAQGWYGVSGIYNEEQGQAWRKVTDAVLTDQRDGTSLFPIIL
jgi:short subunit dehydrogenase/NADH:flavin oxidoreductase/NADH oxidase family protein